MTRRKIRRNLKTRIQGDLNATASELLKTELTQKGKRAGERLLFDDLKERFGDCPHCLEKQCRRVCEQKDRTGGVVRWSFECHSCGAVNGIDAAEYCTLLASEI